MPRSKFIRWTPEDDGAWISASGKTYWCMRAGKTAKFPPPGCASIMCDSGNRRRVIKFTHVPIGELLHNLIEGIPIQPAAKKWITIVFRDEDWKKMESIKRPALRIIKGGDD